MSNFLSQSHCLFGPFIVHMLLQTTAFDTALLAVTTAPELLSVVTLSGV